MRVLFLTHRLPFAPNRGDRIRSFHVLAELQRKFTVDLVSLTHDSEEVQAAAVLRGRGVNVQIAAIPRIANYLRGVFSLSSERPLTTELLYSPAMRELLTDVVARHPPDVVLAYCSSMARYALEPPLRSYPLVLDMVDVDSQKWSSLAETKSMPMRYIFRREARCLISLERSAMEHAVVTLVVNEREQATLQRLEPGADVRVVPNGVDLVSFRPTGPPSSEPLVVFCGVMDYPPNVEAARRLVHGIWPKVAARHRQARLVLLGANPTREVRGFATNERVEVTGRVPDVRPFLWRSALAAAPILTARGIQNKVLESLAAGLPSVISQVVADGLPPAVMPGCRIAATDEMFANEILELLELSPSERRAMADRADLAGLAWEQRLRSLESVMVEAARVRRA